VRYHYLSGTFRVPADLICLSSSEERGMRMNLKFAGPITVAICGVLASSGADASTLVFSGDSQGTSYASFADGTVSTNGFFHFGVTTQALTGSQNDTKIFFTTPVELNSLTLSAVPGTNTQSPTTITVLTFDSSNNQLGSKTVSPFGVLSFNEMGVSTVEFDFTRDDGGVTAAYIVSDVIYTVPAVPEPSTWAMMILGFAGIGFMAYRRSASAALPA
jgi:hypothetical protein